MLKPFVGTMLIMTLVSPVYSNAAEESYFSQLANKSNGLNLVPYKLVKTRVWPETGCVIDSGKEVVNPGDTSNLRVSNKQGCDQAGIGYSLYKMSDTNNKNLLGYVSHRFRDGKFSLQVSVFCVGQQCVFKDLSPQQESK